MASSLWKFIKSKVANTDRTKINELLLFNKAAQHGFPECPTALTLDTDLSLLAIATGLGAVHIFGGPGVELLYQDENQTAIKHLMFIPNTGRLVALHEGGNVTLLELNVRDNVTVLEKAKHAHFSKLEKISAAAIVKLNAGYALVTGNKDGEIFMWTVPGLEIVEGILILEALTNTGDAEVPTEKRSSPGEVMALASHPGQTGLVLIGFASGIVALFDIDRKELKHICFHDQGLTSVSWMTNGESFHASFNDGGYMTWFLKEGLVTAAGNSTVPYGPFPCMPLHKTLILPGGPTNPANLVVFSGGLPRDRPLSDRHSVSMNQGDLQTALEFSSPIVDFIVLEDGAVPSEPHALIVLLQNRLVTVDLTNGRHPEIIAPHLINIFSPVTSFELYENVPVTLLTQLEQSGTKPSDRRPFGGYTPKCSPRPWPIHGGKCQSAQEVTQHDLLITAHGDGCLRFWDASGLQLRLLHKLDSPSRYYQLMDETDAHDDTYEVWPQFRKYGFQEEAVSDPRLQIEKFVFDPLTKTLAVGGKAGQVLVYQFIEEYAVIQFRTIQVELVGEEYEYVWRGTQALPHREGNLDSFAGFQAMLNVQLDPPSEVTALALHPEWQLLAIGTGHGFAAVDYVHQRKVFTHTTLNLAESSETHETVQQKARRAGDTLRRSLRRFPRPHLPMRSPTSYTFSLGHQENGAESKKTKLTEDAVDLTGGRLLGSPSKEPLNGLKGPEVTSSETFVNENGGHVEKLETHVVSREKVLTNGQNGETVETLVVKNEKKIREIVAPIAFEKSVQFSPVESEVIKTETKSETTNGQSSSIIVDEAIMESLEKDIMPPGLEEDAGEEEKTELVKPEKVYNYEATTVRSLLFSNSFLISEITASPCMWAGLNNGRIFAYTLDLTTPETRDQPIKALLAKEIHLRHGAPVIFLAMLDDGVCGRTGEPISTPLSGTASPTPPGLVITPSTSAAVVDEISPPTSPQPTSPMSTGKAQINGLHGQSGQKLLVASEEQLKIFHLPSLKPYGKYKLSSTRFQKVRLVQVGPLKEDLCVAALTARGEVDVYSLPGLKRQLRASLAKKENLSVVLGQNGQGLFQSGTNELQRFFITPTATYRMPCLVTLPEDARPIAVPPVVASMEAEKTTTGDSEPATTEKLVEETATTSCPPAVTSIPAKVEIVELADGPPVTVVIQRDVTVVPVTETGSDGQTTEEVLTIEHTVQTVTFSSDLCESKVMAGRQDYMAGGDAENSRTVTMVLEEVTVDVEPLNESMLGAAGDLADMTSDSIIDYAAKLNGQSDDDAEVAQHKVHNMEEKLKELGLEEDDPTFQNATPTAN